MQPHDLPLLIMGPDAPASGPATIPRQLARPAAPETGRTHSPDVVAESFAMASRITIRVPGHAVAAAPSGGTAEVVDRALGVFDEVNEQCTRFEPDSDLMRANAEPAAWTAVGPRCFEAIREAQLAYRETQGRFDPRVLDDLVRLGYEHSFTRGGPAPRTLADVTTGRSPLGTWEPGFRPVSREVRVAGSGVREDLGRHRVDLGGIGKGLAVRWAAEALSDAGYRDFLVEAGGDCYCAGRPVDAPQWRVGVEDPGGGPDPVAVLAVSDEAVATSSVRIRHWDVEGATVHHLLDPTTGRPGGMGLQSVTVVLPDPATAEVWSKVLFLAGAAGIAREVEQRRLPALWVGADGHIGVSPFLGDRLIWRLP